MRSKNAYDAWRVDPALHTTTIARKWVALPKNTLRNPLQSRDKENGRKQQTTLVFV